MRHELPHNRGRHRVGGSRDGAAHVRRRHERFDTPQTTTARTVCFGLFVGMTLVIFWAPLTRLVQFSLENRSEEHTSELQSQSNLVCRLLLEKKKKHNAPPTPDASHH